mmetsp:Transcript_13362/g.36859  ORF Transcript_13362/g.36859 Transcript_13362/m.36859 type:complete len:200 (+) Transcript_13362:1006-1605(+)
MDSGLANPNLASSCGTRQGNLFFVERIFLIFIGENVSPTNSGDGSTTLSAFLSRKSLGNRALLEHPCHSILEDMVLSIGSLVNLNVFNSRQQTWVTGLDGLQESLVSLGITSSMCGAHSTSVPYAVQGIIVDSIPPDPELRLRSSKFPLMSFLTSILSLQHKVSFFSVLGPAVGLDSHLDIRIQRGGIPNVEQLLICRR